MPSAYSAVVSLVRCVEFPWCLFRFVGHAQSTKEEKECGFHPAYCWIYCRVLLVLCVPFFVFRQNTL